MGTRPSVPGMVRRADAAASAVPGVAAVVAAGTGHEVLAVVLALVGVIVVLALLTRRLGARHHEVVAGRAALEARLTSLERSTTDRFDALAAQLHTAAEASGRQHATIDHRVVTLHARDHEQTSALDRALTQATKELAALRGEVHDLRGELRSLGRAHEPTGPATTTPRLPDARLAAGGLSRDVPAAVVLVLNSYAPGAVFAGIRTALVAGGHAALMTSRPLRVVVLDGTASQDAVLDDLRGWLEAETPFAPLAAGLRVSVPTSPPAPHHPDDVWVATFWTTAVALQQACEAGLARRDHAVHLVQDWEPAFMAWGSDFALARATYDAGFRLLVNSVPLATYVHEQTGVPVPPDQVFHPQLDVPRLHAAASAWRPGDAAEPRLLVYYRPSKPRNLAATALAAVRVWADGLPAGTRPLVTLAGEDAPAPDLGPVRTRPMGKLSFEAYHSLLAETDLGLALMYSPHPSHLPLELPVAGIPTVTNALGGVRRPWVDGLVVADPTPRALARGLDEAAARAAGRTLHTPVGAPADLGGSLEDALAAALRGLLPD